ncbi:MAG: class I SAM-dependent methyltransferase [Actinomycetota bacterium]|nr:class I SAM-dependent methyltransferase [Actinomycetota bacterium]
MTTTTEVTETITRQRDALGERLFGCLLDGMELLTVQLGVQTGLYAALRDCGPATAGELAASAGVAERYAREWLEQQATAGFVEVIAPGDPAQRRYALPLGHAEALLDEESPGYMAAAAPSLMGLTKALAEVAAAYRTGEGVAFSRYGAEIRHGIGSFNRPMFANELATEWLPALGDVHTRLGSGVPARVLDVGCGTGWSSIALARAYPGVHVDGVDLDEASVADARHNAAEAGVADRTRFEAGDAAAFNGAGGYDLVCVFEALHDMGDPVGALRQIRGLLGTGAPLLVVDERTAESFTAPGDEVERLLYAFSVLHCLPATLAESPKIAHGTVLRADTVRQWARDAGYASVEILPIANDLWRFYRLEA